MGDGFRSSQSCLFPSSQTRFSFGAYSAFRVKAFLPSVHTGKAVSKLGAHRRLIRKTIFPSEVHCVSRVSLTRIPPPLVTRDDEHGKNRMPPCRSIALFCNGAAGFFIVSKARCDPLLPVSHLKNPSPCAPPFTSRAALPPFEALHPLGTDCFPTGGKLLRFPAPSNACRFG